MSKLEELIQEYCPDGVEYKTIGDIGPICMCKRILKAQTNESDGVPFYKIGTFGGVANTFISKELYNDYKEKYSYPKPGEILISAAGTIGRRVIFDGNPSYFQDSNIVWVSNDETQVLNKFLYYYYDLHPWQVSTGGTIARLYNDNIAKTKLPVPPLPVQREIVRILDNFTKLSAALAAELSAELAARRKQYEYYRDELLTFKTEVEWKTIDECTQKTNNIKWKDTEGDYQYIDLSSVDRELSSITETTTINSSNAPSRAQQIIKTNDILFGTTRPLLKRYCIVPEEYDNQIASTGYCVLRANEEIVLHDYLYHVITTNAFYRYLEPLQVEGSYPSVTNASVKAYKMPVPSKDVQTRIVKVLNNFEALCNDLEIGLPAEIEARQKQYEYYRDKLLTFKEQRATT